MAAAHKPRRSSRGASKHAGSQRQVPGWVWFFTGLTTGLFILFLYQLASVTPDNRPTPAEETQTNQPEPEQDNDSQNSGPRFDFYAVLPRMEVIVPKNEPEPARDKEHQKEGTQSDDTLSSGMRNRQFLLQAGSFRRIEDADRRRAELILLGLDARIQPVQLASGDTWHRVMVGPFESTRTLHQAQDRLALDGIETLPIRVNP